MKAGDFAAVMAALGRVGRELKREREGDFAASLARTAPDDQIERMDTQCVECGNIHPGLWQYMPGGRRIRVPIVHEIRGERCPGSFAAAVLRERSTTGEPEQ